VKALLVDLYETLVWTDWQALGHLLAARLDVDGSTLSRAFEVTSRGRGTGLYGSVKGDLAAIVAAAAPPGAGPDAGRGAGQDAFLDALESELGAFLTANTHVYPDVRPVLRALRDSGTRVAIVSNCDHATGPLLNNLGLAGDVDATVLSFEVRSIKPDITSRTSAREICPTSRTFCVRWRSRLVPAERPPLRNAGASRESGNFRA